MKTGRIFWGFLFLTVGALFFLVQYNFISQNFYFVWNLWPLFLIFLGLAIITKGTKLKPLISAIFGILIGIILYGTFQNITNWNFYGSNYDDNTSTYLFTSNNPIPDYAQLNLTGGAGAININGVSNTLFKVSSNDTYLGYKINTIYDKSNDIASVYITGVNHRIINNKMNGNINIALNDKPIWNFYIEIGAANAKFDFSKYKVKNISFKSGASAIKVKLGNKLDSTNIDIKIGVASLKLFIPRDSGCRIISSSFPIIRNFPGFNKIGYNTYITTNFNEAKNKIFVNLKSGIASFQIKRY